MSVLVPRVDRGLRLTRSWSMKIVEHSPEMLSTGGLSNWAANWRA